jgi:hypothetical protein
MTSFASVGPLMVVNFGVPTVKFSRALESPGGRENCYEIVAKDHSFNYVQFLKDHPVQQQ